MNSTDALGCGCNGNPPCRTVQHAVNVAGEGNSIVFEEGIFTLPSTLLILREQLFIANGKVIFDCERLTSAMLVVSGTVTMTGITIMNCVGDYGMLSLR